MRTTWRIGSWTASFEEGWIKPRAFRGKRTYPDRRLMLVLAALARQHGELVSNEDLLHAAWPDRVVSKDSVTTAIYQLRQLLADKSDNSHNQQYIRSEPRRGYRLVATCKRTSYRPESWRRRALPIAATLVSAFAILLAFGGPDTRTRYLVMEPLLDKSELAEMAALSAAIESTLLSELISIAPGRILSTADNAGQALTMQSAVVACDRGPALVVRVHDPLQQTYVWSGSYPLDAETSARGGATLVEHIASEVAGELLITPN